MSKVTKKELLRRIEALEEWSIGADDMLTELNHALPDPEYDAKCEENAVAVQASLDRHAVRLGLVKPELTGSDLCRAMLARGDKYVMCLVSDSSQEDTLLDGYSAAISSMTYNECFYGYDFTWLYATPINNQGEALTATDVGL